MALALDGVANVVNNSTSSIPITYTTTVANDVLIIAVACGGSVGITVSTITGGTGTAWAKRKALAWTSGANSADLEVWWSPAVATLAANVFTITLSGTPTVNTQVTCFAVSGSNPQQPWDGSPTHPNTASITTTGSHPNSALSTLYPNTMLLGFTATSNTTAIANGVGYTKVMANNGAGKWTLAVEEQVVSALQTAVSVNFSTTITQWGIIVDALIALVVQTGAAGTTAGGSPVANISQFSVLGVPATFAAGAPETFTAGANTTSAAGTPKVAANTPTPSGPGGFWVSSTP